MSAGNSIHSSTCKLDEGQQAELVALYRSGVSAKQLAFRFSISHSTVQAYLRRHGVAIRSKSEATRLGRGTTLREDAFDVISEESAYWVGFLMADGCVRSKTPVISLGLAIKDRGHVEKFKEFLGSSHRISDKFSKAKRGTVCHSVEIQVPSKRIAKALERYGVVPRKTESAQAIGLSMNRNFWRGVVDGDGCLQITTRGLPTVLLVGTEMLMTQFKDFVLSISPTSQSTVRKIARAKLWSFKVNGQHASKLVKVLYENCTVSLARKLIVAENIINLPTKRRIIYREYSIEKLIELYKIHGSWLAVAKDRKTSYNTLHEMFTRVNIDGLDPGLIPGRKFRTRSKHIGIGERFGRLEVIGGPEERRCARNRHNPMYYLVRCDCGTEKSVEGYKLITGNTKSCGCLSREKLIARNRVSRTYMVPGSHNTSDGAVLVE